jgi:hypothetical protein
VLSVIIPKVASIDQLGASADGATTKLGFLRNFTLKTMEESIDADISKFRLPIIPGQEIRLSAIFNLQQATISSTMRASRRPPFILSRKPQLPLRLFVSLS